jgi:TRAP-type uncharacterized transport system fused permease subunit
LAASLHGYLLAALSMWQRLVLFVAAILLIAPDLISSVVGIILLAVIAIDGGLMKRIRPVAGPAA